MPETFHTTRRVEFCETDAAGIAHFAALICYMEQAEHALMRELGESVVRSIPGEADWHLSWPRVHVECDYQGTAKFEETLDIAVSVERLGGKSVTYGFEITNQSKPVANGKVVAVCCKVKPGQPLESVAIPDDLADKLKRYLRA